LAPTMSEGFGLTLLEAMSCGLPVIATGYSGHMDFLKDKHNGITIDYKMKEVKFDVSYEGVSWAMPSIKHLRKEMRQVFEHREELEIMSKNAIETSKKYTWEKSAIKAINAIKLL